MKFGLFLQWYKAFFSQEGRYPGYRHTQRAENTLIHNLVVKGERSGYRQDPITSSTSGTSIYIPYGKRERVRASRDPQYGTRKSYGGRQGPVRGQAETPPGGQRPSPRRAETLTLEGANQDIKESGHRSRRPPAHKGYNQFIKDARRSQRATQLSQLKPMEGKF